jgi:hypothetical protein
MAAESHGIRRSSHWPTVEKHFLAANPGCFVCSADQHQARIKQVGALATRGLQVHHKFPFHFCILLGRPDLEVDPRNLVVLCEDELGVATEDHHNIVGHYRNFQSWDDALDKNIATYKGRSKHALMQDPTFIVLCSKLPPTWARMTDDDKKAMRALLDRTYPT